jgi:hypothetical protein
VNAPAARVVGQVCEIGIRWLKIEKCQSLCCRKRNQTRGGVPSDGTSGAHQSRRCPDTSACTDASDSGAEEELLEIDDPRLDDFTAAFGRSGRKKYEAMLQWRIDSNIDTILQRPHEKFFVFKEAYPFYIHGQ